MANKVQLKKSSVAARVPLTADVDYGELALNYADGKLYYKKSDGTTIDYFPSVAYVPLLSGSYANPTWITSLDSSKLTGTIDNARLNGGTYGINITGNAATASAVAWTGVTGKPTTLSGYGITDAYSSSNPAGYITSSALSSYQPILVSGTNIKTVNGTSLLGSGDLTVSASTVPWTGVTSKPSNIMYYQGFTLDANTMDSNSTGFTYSVNAPATGPVARFSTGGGYDLWLNSAYSGGNTLYFRTRNGDAGSVNAWRALASYGVNYADSLYSTVLYDSNDTGYYVDPNTTGVSYRGRGQILLGPNTSSRYLRLGGDGGATDYPTVSTSNGNLHIDAQSGYQLYLAWYNGSDVMVGGGIQATIYYDRNNTGYYSDPTSVSSLNQVVANRIILDRNYGHSIFGTYASTRYQGVWSMGQSWALPDDGTTTGNLYGLAWSHPNAGGTAGNLNTHGLLVLENGGFLAALSGSIRCRDDMRTPIYYDSNNTGYYMDANNTSRMNAINADSLYSYGNVTAYSDENLKTDWEDLPQDYIEQLAKVKSGKYTRIDTKDRQAGVGAQSFKNILPEVVIKNGEYLGVNYGNAALVSAVELAKRVVEQDNRIARLEELISKLIDN